MGIPHFGRFLSRFKCKHPPQANYNHVLIDANALLYGKDSGEDENILQKAKGFIINSMKKYKPTSTLAIFLDGVPPNGKIPTQLQRREEHKTAKRSSMVSPGTQFMCNFEKSLEDIAPK